MTKLSGIIVAALLIFLAAGPAKADDWCGRQIRHEQHELNEAIRRHGYYSWQADHHRRELNRVLDRCRAYDYRR